MVTDLQIPELTDSGARCRGGAESGRGAGEEQRVTETSCTCLAVVRIPERGDREGSISPKCSGNYWG